MSKTWTAESLSELMRGFQSACVLSAAADLDVFSALAGQPMTAVDLTQKLSADERAMSILLDALVALELLTKEEGVYHVPASVVPLLTESGQDSILAGVRHLGHCLRRWSQLGRVVKHGGPADDCPSIRGKQADTESFIGAMQVFTQSIIPPTLERLQPLNVCHLLDIGGASGNWTQAFLEAVPQAQATLFDLPDVIALARRHLSRVGLLERVTLVAGDFNEDDLPTGADLAWLSAITHQNSRSQNRALFTRIHNALEPQGVLIVRDIIMSPDHVRPVMGALFAVNMLTATPAGGTFTLEQYTEDLTAAGFSTVDVLHQEDSMNCLIKAVK